MPTRTDVTVVNKAYDTSGNGGRKLVRLSNGWLVASAYDSTGKNIFLYVDKQDGQGFQQLCYINPNNTTDLLAYHALVAKDNKVYVLYSVSTIKINLSIIDALSVTNTNQYNSSITIDNFQSGFNGVSLAINSAGTELHAAWASKNSTYPNSFNIRYCKGTINGDGSVTWGAVEQVTAYNVSGYDFISPSIVVKNNDAHICAVQNHGGIYRIVDISKVHNGTYTTSSNNFVNGYGAVEVYYGGSYYQVSPSACVAPNGRIWVAWYGYDSTDTTRYNIRVSYSDDGGVTWSAMQKLTSGNTYHQLTPSITVDKNNNVYVVWSGTHASSTTYYQIRKIKWDGSTWGSIVNVTSNTTADATNPSTLYDTTINVLEPLFIYQNVQTSKVGFYGTWTVTTISVTPGYIGQKTSSDKSNILTYSITTDGTMGTITEKINGTTIATRTNPTSGQQFTVSLTQEQWDAIQYGNAHTLTIEMGSDTWTYTFDKRLNANDDILSAVKGVQDLQTHLNGIKAQLGTAIRAKGGTVNDTDAWSAFVSAVANISAKKFASGTVTSSSESYAFQYASSSSTTNCPSITVTGLTFKPSLIIVFGTNNTSITIYSEIYDSFYGKTVKVFKYDGASFTINNLNFKGDVSPVSITSTGFVLPVWHSSGNYFWIAFE
jgi:hypothetical protein